MSLLLLLAALSATMLLGGGRLLDEARDRVDGWGVWAPLAFALLYALAETALAPGAVLTASAGALFGVVTGTVTVLVGATAGAVLSFGLARWLGRPAVARWAGTGRLARLDAMMSQRGFAAVLILRLIPLFPFALVNYAAGVTGVRLLPYVTATAIGIVPATVAYTGLGGTLDDPSSPGFWAALGALALLAAGGSWAARRLRAAHEPRRDGAGERAVRDGQRPAVQPVVDDLVPGQQQLRAGAGTFTALCLQAEDRQVVGEKAGVAGVDEVRLVDGGDAPSLPGPPETTFAASRSSDGRPSVEADSGAGGGLPPEPSVNRRTP